MHALHNAGRQGILRIELSDSGSENIKTLESY